MVPPVPIPNTAVKHTFAYNTALATAWKFRSSPIFLSFLGFGDKAFFFNGDFGEVVNTSDCGSDMRGFDSHKPPHRGIVQLVEQRSPKP